MQNKLKTLVRSSVLSAVVVGVSVSAAVLIVPRTVMTPNFFVGYNPLDPESIDTINWSSSPPASGPNLTKASDLGGCATGYVEYFGNSWAPPDPPFGGKVLVGAGTTGTWAEADGSKVVIDSISMGCPSSAAVPVQTIYKFWDNPSGRSASGPWDRFKVERTFTFTTAFNFDIRPYIPRLYQLSSFSQVVHPDASYTSLVVEDVFNCDFGCTVTNWNGNDPNPLRNWFAMHDPGTGRGVIVGRQPTPSLAVRLWVDNDCADLPSCASRTNSSSVLLLHPGGGFTGIVTETEFLCFYDSGIWSPSLVLPRGCGG